MKMSAIFLVKEMIDENWADPARKVNAENRLQLTLFFDF
jgi:hypothetical protein